MSLPSEKHIASSLPAEGLKGFLEPKGVRGRGRK